MLFNNSVPNDRRCRKTRLAIKSALLMLMKDKPISKITVSELTETADVNRKTFYNHYSDISNVLHEIENEFLEKIFSLIDGDNIWGEIENPAPFFQKLFGEIQNNIGLFELLVKSGEHIHLVFSFRARLRTLWGNQIKERAGVSYTELMYLMDFVSSGVVAIFESWVKNPDSMPLEKLSQLISCTISGATHSLIGRAN